MSVKHRVKDRLPNGNMHRRTNKSRQCLMTTPSWWIREMETRPDRRKVKRECRSVITGADPENAMFPVYGKPHIYFW